MTTLHGYAISVSEVLLPTVFKCSFRKCTSHKISFYGNAWNFHITLQLFLRNIVCNKKKNFLSLHIYFDIIQTPALIRSLCHQNMERWRRIRMRTSSCCLVYLFIYSIHEWNWRCANRSVSNRNDSSLEIIWCIVLGAKKIKDISTEMQSHELILHAIFSMQLYFQLLETYRTNWRFRYGKESSRLNWTYTIKS